MTGKRGKAHHAGTYAKHAALVRAAARANPDARCWRCGEGARAGDPWQAGHVIDGQINGELRAEHRSCNSSAGAAHGNQLREPRSQRWY